MTHQDWTQIFLATPTVLGVIDTYGIELIHPMREGRSPQQIGRKGLPTICQPQFVIFLPHLHDRLTMNLACIITGAMTQHGHEDTQQSVGKIAQGLAMALPLRP